METKKWDGGSNNPIESKKGPTEGRKEMGRRDGKIKNSRPNSKYIHNFTKCKCLNIPMKKQLSKWI